MNLEDRIKLSCRVSAAVITDEAAASNLYDETGSNALAHSIGAATTAAEFDDDLNPVEWRTWQQEFKCKILPNTSARKVTGTDGADYVYSYEVFLRKPRQAAFIPRENDTVHLTKKDGTINRDMRCIGFVTLRSWLKIWV